MPKMKAPTEELTMAAEIRERYGGAFVLTLTQVGEVVGYKSRSAAVEWVETLVPRWRGKVRVWLVSDVAHKLYAGQSREVSA